MATGNPFDLLGNDDNEDPSQLILAAEQLKKAALAAKKAPVQAAPPAKAGKLPTKPLPPSQAVEEARNEGGRNGARGAGRGRGRGRIGGELNKEHFNNESTYGGPPAPFKRSEEGEAGKSFERRGGYGGPRGSFRGGRRGGYSNDDVGEGERPRRVYERHSGTGRDNGFKRDGAGRGNWGTPTDEISPETEGALVPKEKVEDAEKQSREEDVIKEKTEEEVEEKEPEVEEMTLEEYEKVLEEKKKALLTLKTTEERKVDDREFKSMLQISSKKNNDEIFIKLSSEKGKRKEVAEKEEKVRKSVNITEFLKPVEGERSYGGRGRGRGRGRGPRGGFNGGSYTNNAPPANIADPVHFPAFGGH